MTRRSPGSGDVQAILFDSGGVLMRPIGGRWNPRADFEETVLAHDPSITNDRFAAAIDYVIVHSHQHLAEEFERRLADLCEQGVVPDPRAAQIERLKEQVTALKARLADRETQFDGLTDFRQPALSQLAAQRIEIERLREVLAEPSNILSLPNSSRATAQAPYGSCS